MSDVNQPRRAIDTAGMRRAMAGFITSLEPSLSLTDCQGVTARMLKAVPPAFCEALAYEMDANSDATDTYRAVVAVLSNIAGSSARTFSVPGETDEQRFVELLRDIADETIRRLRGAGTFTSVAYDVAGRA